MKEELDIQGAPASAPAASAPAALTNAAKLSDDWYLLAYRNPSARSSGYRRHVAALTPGTWRSVGIVSAVVFALGLGLTYFTLARGRGAEFRTVQTSERRTASPSSQRPTLPLPPVPAAAAISHAAVSTPALATLPPRRATLRATTVAAPMLDSKTSTSPVLSPEEASRLKTRNKRLEALIYVLRQRARAPEKRSNPDSTSVLGQ